MIDIFHEHGIRRKSSLMNHADKGNVAVYISMHIGTVNYASTGLGTLFFKSGVIQSVFCF